MEIRERLEEKMHYRSWLGTLNLDPCINGVNVLMNYFHDLEEWYENVKMIKRKLT